MKESVTKFDFESAFKALDDITIPVAEKGIRSNRPALTEIFSRKSKFDSLFEEYYDIDSTEGLDDAKAAREAEVAKAKLDRIEKIVDLDADSPEDLLTSYVGKYIMQCPQCMTLFYKDKEDIVEAEDDPSTVNVNEICQHCGNESGYTLVGKVGEAEAESQEEIPADLEATEGEEPELEVPAEETSDEPSEDDLAIDLDAINLEDEPVEEEEKTEEAFVAHTGETLVEEVQDDKDLDAKLEAHNEYIEYLRDAISQEEAALEKATNEQVKVAIQRNIDAFKADLEAALPDAVKNDEAIVEEPVEEVEAVEEPVEETTTEEAAEADEVVESLTEALHEDKDLDVSADEFEELINSPEFKKPISDADARAMINAENEDENDNEVDEALTEGNLLDLGKAVGKGIINAGKGLKKVASVAIDKIGAFVKSREEKADWLLAYTLLDYKTAEFKDNGVAVAPQETERKFNKFLVVGFKEKNSHRQIITRPQPYNTKGLIPGDDGVKEFNSYKEADSFAKGWSTGEGNGPAFIYLTKARADKNTAFLCEYFKGKLEFDQVVEYFKTVNKYWESAWRTSGAAVKDKTPKNVAEPKFAFESKNSDSTLNTIMEQLEDLQEAELEVLISNSLVEAYGNVAGFRLAECAYVDNKFTVDGTIYFISGNTRKTTYSFTEAYKEDDKIKFIGLNEKLGAEKRFTLTGKVNTDNKTFITESFSNK